MATEKKASGKSDKKAPKKAAKPAVEETPEPEAVEAQPGVSPEDVEEEEQAREPQGEEAVSGTAAKAAVRPVKRAAKPAAVDEEAGEEAAQEPKAKAAVRPVKGAAKPAAGDEPAGDEVAEEPKAKPAKKHAARPSPKLSPELKKALAQRSDKDAHRPAFHRQEWFRYQRLGDKWRAPQGIQSKMRRHWGTHADVVSIGYRGPKAARGLHPSGFREVMVHNEDSIDSVDPKTEAVRIASSVGRRKREIIQKAAAKRGIRVLNWRQL